jgi:predicted O-methyltransferase YrrM
VIGSETYADWDMNTLKLKAHTIAENHRNILVMDCSTHEASTLFQDESFDLVFIDADHTYEGVAQDIKDWMPKLKKGGYLFGHDIDWLSVQYGVRSIFREYNKDDDNLWWVIPKPKDNIIEAEIVKEEAE